MPATTPQPSKVQPWKANWPPAKQTSGNAGQKYMVDDTGAVLSDGDAGDGFLSEFACSRKKIEAPKDASNTSHPYMVDGTGALLVDGDSGGGSGFFVELACSNKDTGHTYLVDGSGSLLIDGASGGGPDDLFTELACSRQPVGKE